MSDSTFALPQTLTVLRDLLERLAALSSFDGVRLLVERVAALTPAHTATLYLVQDLTRVITPAGAQTTDEKHVAEVIGWAEPRPTGTHDSPTLPNAPARAEVLRDTGGLLGVLLLPTPPAPEADESVALLLGLLTQIAAKLRAEDARARYIHNQDQFVTDFVHDLRTPMTVVKSTADVVETALAQSGDTGYSKMLKRIMGNIDAISDLLEHVFVAGVYDPDTGRYTLMREPVDLETIVSSIIKNLTASAQKKGLQLSASIDSGLPILSADKSMLSRAVTNLVDNAVKYTNEGEVAVRVQRMSDGVLISVRDTGVGLGEEAKRRVFEKFFRANNLRHSNIKGTGLGLFIVHSAAVHHGGRAWVESEPDKGSTFFLSLPLRHAAES
ncbi:MAG: HAMP domain-containing histidine kinase [Anaerolineae bacterium]|nr:HAMP domain-containing histidine kinase [Anaerolineae bacterium]